ncbi:unnamed protein product [Mycena citricolor]|uniref:Ribosome maturation protein SDO1/SBDS N-terminal domain-containing protein n=1 Tax=Mycena citricolor TaxID=2018698 RepID=A0AAD2K3D6_9AGAR|nr:unnamed protein product [Mycena citricolor]CAK5275441.1 unnamed protein product [Mycena citricolor]
MVATSKVIYKPDSQSTEEYVVIVNTEEFNKWKGGETTIPLADVVDSFQVFFSSQGAQGMLDKPSYQQLDTVFGTHKDTDVVTKVLKEGRAQGNEGISSGFTGGNASRTNNDTRGSGARI